MPTSLKIILYPLIALFFLVLFSLLLFPIDSLKERLIQEAEQGIGDPYQLSVQELSYFPPASFTLKGVQIGIQGAGQSAQEEKDLIRFEKVKLVFRPLSLLWGDLNVRFDLREKKSRLSGDLASGREAIKVRSDLEQIDLALLGLLTSRWKISLQGSVSGTVDLEWFKDNPIKNNGEIQLQVNSLELKNINIPDILTLPSLSLVDGASGPSKIILEISRANWNVESLQLRGQDMELNVNGKIYGARRMDNYRFNLKGVMKLATPLVEKVPLLGVIESYKDASGLYPLTITGRIASPNIRIGDFKVPLF